jgi:hypothetical protein
MKKYINTKNITIVILIILLFLVFLNPGGHLPNRTVYVPKIDSIPYTVHDTVMVDSLVEVEVEVPYEVSVDRLVEVTVIQPVDTAAILKDFNAKNEIKDVLTLPNGLGVINLNETVTQNKITSRTFEAKVTPKIEIDTIYTPQPLKNVFYFGLNGGFNKVDVISHIGAGIMLKTKTEKIFQLGVGVSNRVIDGTNGTLSPYLNGGVYWKIKLKK